MSSQQKFRYSHALISTTAGWLTVRQSVSREPVGGDISQMLPRSMNDAPAQGQRACALGCRRRAPTAPATASRPGCHRPLSTTRSTRLQEPPRKAEVAWGRLGGCC